MAPRGPDGFPRCVRLRKRAEYLSVQGSGRKLHSDSFLLFLLRRSDAPTRFGITVSKRVGGAVVRNRVKRLVREVVRRHKSWFPTGAELVFVAKPSAKALGYRAAEQEVERLCHRSFAAS
jgi:ribonuclease P protein component